MKGVLRFTLLGAFLAAGIGVAVALALRTEKPASKVTSATSPVEIEPARSAEPGRVAPDAESAPVQSDSEGTSVLSDAQNAVYQMTIAQQMGRIEEKLRRAEEAAE